MLHIDREHSIRDRLEEVPSIVARRVGDEDVVRATPSDQLRLKRLGNQHLIGEGDVLILQNKDGDVAFGAA